MDYNETLKQLGGQRFIVMVGARELMKAPRGTNTMSFRFMQGKEKITHLIIYLNSMDTYDLEFGKIFAHTFVSVKKVKGVYADQLQQVFTEVTGLRTHL